MNHPFGKYHLPLFPLNTVIFVNGILQLQIFEQRYLNLIRSCMKNQHGFISVLIRNGKEVDDIPETHTIGTYVDIIDFDTLDNNLLGITIQGRQRVHINKTHIHDDNLISAEINYIDNLLAQNNDVLDDDLLSLLHTLHRHPFVTEKYPDFNHHCVIDSAYKLCELLPTSNNDKQKLLEADQSSSLLDQLKVIVTRLEN